MKISAQEEYGLRILLQLAKSSKGLSISEIAKLEDLTIANTAKFCRLLRLSGYLKSTKGKDGGYHINMLPEDIRLDELMISLDPPLYGDHFCDRFCDDKSICTHATDCQVKKVWIKMQGAIQNTLRELTLSDLL
jgi:Rrf2 family protein